VSDTTLEQTGHDITEHDVTGQDYDTSELDSLDWDMTGEGLVQEWDTIGSRYSCGEYCLYLLLKPLYNLNS
jgi:hypothetical protein